MPENEKFNMNPVFVSDEILEGFKLLPTATVYNAVKYFSSSNNYTKNSPCVCEGLKNYTPGQKIAARAKTLRFLPLRQDIGVVPGMF